MPTHQDIRWDRDGVHEYHRMFRRILDSYPGERMAVGEAWVPDAERLARYVRPDELNLTFNFELTETMWNAKDLHDAIDRSLLAMAGVGAPCTWVLDNHDVDRCVTRFGDGQLGQNRARAAALMQLSLPGAAYVYNGDELGLPNVDLPDSALQDPTWKRSGYTERGRDGERVPLPWSGDRPPFGFSTSGTSWLPMPADWATLTVAAQEADPESTLALYRRALAIRSSTADLRDGDFEWLDAPADCIAYRRGGIHVLINASSEPVPLPKGELLLASESLTDGQLPPDSASWLSS